MLRTIPSTVLAEYAKKVGTEVADSAKFELCGFLEISECDSKNLKCDKNAECKKDKVSDFLALEILIWALSSVMTLKQSKSFFSRTV